MTEFANRTSLPEISMSHAATDLTLTPQRALDPPDRGAAPGWWILPMAFLGALIWAWVFSRLL